METNKWWQSSAGNGKLALTIKGILVGLVPVTLGLLKSRGVDIPENELVTIIDNVVSGFSAFLVLFGLGRKAWYRL